MRARARARKKKCLKTFCAKPTVVKFLSPCLILPETSKKRDLASLQIKNIACAYGRQFKDLNLVLWSCLMGLSTAIIFIFAQEAPDEIRERVSLSTE
jgi:hypothetical protein